jgi:Flp pilus assembly protein TadB
VGVSRERARRRELRERERAAAAARRERALRRRLWWRRLWRRLAPRPRRRAWLLGRRSPAQRSLIAGGAIVAIGLIWYLVDPWPLRIGFTLLLALVLPALVRLVFHRRG